MGIASTAHEVERLLTDVTKLLYTRDTQIPGLWDMPVAQLRVLNVLGRGPQERTPTMGELAEALGIALSTTTQITERIEKRGLVRREHSDPDDRRVVRLVLTEEGRRFMAERRRLRHERLSAALAHLTPAQQEDLIAALAPLAVASRHIEQDAAQGDAVLAQQFQEVG